MLSVKSALLIYHKPDLMLKIHRLERHDGPSAFRGKSGSAHSYRWSQRSHGCLIVKGTYRQRERWRVQCHLFIALHEGAERKRRLIHLH